MGTEPNISHDLFPKQGTWLGRAVMVCFNYDTSHQMRGTIVRDDAEEPGRCIIALENGRFVLTTECMWTPIKEGTTQ